MSPVLSEGNLSNRSYGHLFRRVHIRCILRPIGLILLTLAPLYAPLIPKPWPLGLVHPDCQSRSETQITF